MNKGMRRQAIKRGDFILKTELPGLLYEIKSFIITKAVEDYSAAIGLVLRDKLDFGTVRIQRFLDEVARVFQSIQEGHLTVEDIKRTLEEEVGVKIE